MSTFDEKDDFIQQNDLDIRIQHRRLPGKAHWKSQNRLKFWRPMVFVNLCSLPLPSLSIINPYAPMNPTTHTKLMMPFITSTNSMGIGNDLREIYMSRG